MFERGVVLRSQSRPTIPRWLHDIYESGGIYDSGGFATEYCTRHTQDHKKQQKKTPGWKAGRSRHRRSNPTKSTLRCNQPTSRHRSYLEVNKPFLLAGAHPCLQNVAPREALHVLCKV